MSAQILSAELAAGNLYDRLIAAWNHRDAREFAACFLSNGNAIGFDGSLMDGARQIEESLAGVFERHPTAQYVSIVREVRMMGSEAVLLRAEVGMIPPGADKIKPEVNAVQSMVAHRVQGDYARADLKIALFQSTPAQFHGRPEAAEALTKELQSGYDRKGG